MEIRTIIFRNSIGVKNYSKSINSMEEFNPVGANEITQYWFSGISPQNPRTLQCKSINTNNLK